MTGDLWDLFLAEAGGHAERLRTALAETTDSETAAAAAYGLATAALLMGVDEIGLLARTCDRALAHLGATARRPLLLHLLTEAAATLERAFVELAHPDASGARTDTAALDAARVALEVFLEEETAPAQPSTPTESATAPVDASAAGWTPTVDDEMVDLFFEEANERLDGLAQKLLVLETRPNDAELVRDLFRDLHTLKGSSAMVGLGTMNRLAHAAEDLVGQLRDGRHQVDRALVDALLAGLDGLRAIVARAVARQPVDFDIGPVVARLRSPGQVAARSAALEPAAPLAPTAAKQTLRVDFDKLDLLLNLVGELVLAKTGLGVGIDALASLGRELESDRRLARRAIAGSRRASHGATGTRRNLEQLAEELGRVERVFLEVGHDLETASTRVDRVAAELRDQVMKLRMVPIGGVFRKYHRTIRDLANGLGKQVKVELSGEETELDKVLVEQLDEPLLHIVRNAIDHGLETPERRTAAGKSAEGTIRLHAAHRGNQIVIEVSDDGAGIDPAQLRGTALEKGLATAEELDLLDDRQALELIFRPGLSTASRVTDLSGRGVGMDVVRQTVMGRLKGSIALRSTLGAGTVLTLHLPLTLAIIQVLLARAGGEIFAIPLDVVRRSQTVAPHEIHTVGDREFLAIGGRQTPLVRLRDVLELDSSDNDEQLQIVLVELGGANFGLVCDHLLGKQEIVIKSLGALLANVPCAAGATLLGDRPALILDVPALVARATQMPRPPSRMVPVATRVAEPPCILLVEDSDTIRAAMQRSLEAAGYHVTPARDGAEGLALADTAAFDLVSTDVMMPHVDGYELTRALRASARHKDTPIIMVTGRGEKIDRVRGFDAGVDEYLTKPHDRQDFLSAVRRHLEKKP